MLNWAPHLTAAANGINNRINTLNQLHQLQRISAKGGPLNFHPLDDMQDNEDADAAPNKRITFECSSCMDHLSFITAARHRHDICLRLVDIVILSMPRYRYSCYDWASMFLQLRPVRA